MTPAGTSIATYWAIPANEIAERLGSTTEGLTTGEAARRAQTLVATKHTRGHTTWHTLVAQFTSPIVLTLIAAAIVSAFLRDVGDAAIILGIVTVSGLLGFWQEKGASEAVAKLLQLVQVTVTAIRDGAPVEVPVDQVVPGDVVELAAGTTIPGDAVVLTARDLSVDQAALTGETFPASKDPAPTGADAAIADRCNVCFLGTHVVSGTGRILVVGVGPQTEFGKITGRLQATTPPTEFEIGLRRLGTLLVRITLALTLAIFVANVALRKPLLGSFLFSVALAVGLTPQLLPAIVTVNLSHGARRMAAVRVIVKRLAAIEDFGSLTVLCADKTGTLTSGEVAVARAEDAAGVDSGGALELARLNAHLESGFPNPIDVALRLQPAPAGYTKLDEIPYDFERKRLSVLVDGPEGRILVTKGALQGVLGACTSVATVNGAVSLDTVRPAIDERSAALEDEGYRILGVATRHLETPAASTADESDMELAGIVLLADPPKPDAAASVARLEELGVTVKMVTGDSHRVARHVASAVGLRTAQLLTGPDIAALDDDALVAAIAEVDVFAEVDPVQKERIVRAFRRRGEVVGHLGDGINDAPALHAADVGLSVDTAVDVAKEAADFVLLEQDLGVLAAGIEAGRAAFANTMKYIFAATSANFGNMFSMAGASLFLSYLPLLPTQVLLTNLLTDLPEMTIAVDRVDDEAVALPERWDVDMIRRFMLRFGVLSSVFDYVTFGVLLLLLGAGQDEFRTGWFVESVVSAVLVVLVVRTRLPVSRSRPGRPLALASGAVVAAVLVLPFTPLAAVLGFTGLPWVFYPTLAVVVAAYAVSAELLKRRFFGRHGAGRRTAAQTPADGTAAPKPG